MSEVKKYVSSLIFDPHHASVLLVKKRRPAWLEGLWTAVGGGQEDWEVSPVAAFRELEEETGFKVEALTPFACVRREGSICTMFAGELFWPDTPQRRTDEEVKIWALGRVLNGNPAHFSTDLPWLIEMALAALRARRDYEPPPPFLDVTVGAKFQP